MISTSMMPVQASDEGWESLSDSHVFPAAVGHGGDTEADIIDANEDTTVQSAKAMPETILPSKNGDRDT